MFLSFVFVWPKVALHVGFVGVRDIVMRVKSVNQFKYTI
jgi:hypothetical protein